MQYRDKCWYRSIPLDSVWLSPRRVILGLLVGVTVHSAHAQATPRAEADEVPANLRAIHSVRLSPTTLVLTPRAPTATLTLQNPGRHVIEVDVLVQFGYPAWPDNDLQGRLYNHYPNLRDTVIAHPASQDRYAGHWLSGLPSSITLKPHAQRRVTVHITPPTGLADGEYYARVVAVVRPPDRHKDAAKDTKTVYKLPIIGELPPRLQETARIFYRQGAVHMGLAVPTVTTGIGAIPLAQSPQLMDDWIHVPFHLTGNAHFEGVIRHFFRRDDTGEIVSALRPYRVELYHDGVIRHWCDFPASQPVDPGKYTLVVRFEPIQDSMPPAARLPMQPVEVTAPITIK